MLSRFTPEGLFTMLLSLPGIITAITFHEMAHAFAAQSMGDHTAENMGRLSFNPLHHLDILGFLSMLIFGFGWAKPVPVNPYNYKNRRKGVIVVALSGCVTNLIMGFISLAVLYLVLPFANTYLVQILSYMVSYNVMFGIFNLLPIPPLDGSEIVAEFLPYKARQAYLSISRYGIFILLILVWTGLLSTILTPLISGVTNLYQAILLPLYQLLY